MSRKMPRVPVVVRAAASTVCAASAVALFSSTAAANNGTQIPLNQMQAGTEQTSSALIVNPGFEMPGVAGPNATGWDRVDDMSVGAPIAPLPNPPTVVGSFTARGGFDGAKYSQAISLQPNTDYVISAYIWNFGLPGPAPHNDLDPGDLAVVELVDVDNVFNTAGVILEPIALDNGMASNGYFLYETFNSSIFPNGAFLEVEVDLEGSPGQPRPPVVAQFDNIAITPLAQFVPPITSMESTWQTNGGGAWSNTANWTGAVPDAPGAVANFGSAITAPATITLDGNRTVGTVNFNNTNKYTIAGASTLTFDVTSGSAGMTVTDFGTHEIATPIQLLDNTNVRVTLAGSTLRLSNQVSVTGNVTITKTGAGALEMKNVRAIGLDVAGGTTRVIPNGTADATSKVTNLSVDPSSARLDITNNAFTVDYVVTSPFATIRDRIVSAYNGGAWDGLGITSSMANSNTHGIGYAEASSLGGSAPAIFGTFTGDAVLFRYTRYGDANLDGIVNLQDFNRLAANFGATGAIWVQGDFTYDGIVNLQDFNRLAANFGLSAAGPEVTPEDWAALAAAVPEPTSLMLVAAAGAALLARTRRV